MAARHVRWVAFGNAVCFLCWLPKLKLTAKLVTPTPGPALSKRLTKKKTQSRDFHAQTNPFQFGGRRLEIVAL